MDIATVPCQNCVNLDTTSDMFGFVAWIVYGVFAFFNFVVFDMSIYLNAKHC